jgi:hypothetical protein
LERFFKVPRAIIEPRQNVAMQINHGIPRSSPGIVYGS